MKNMEEIYVVNAFSLGMLPEDREIYNIYVEQLTEENAKYFIEKHKNNIISAIGHEGTAHFLSERLGINIVKNRIEVKLNENTTLLVFQLNKRLEEGKVLTKQEINNFPMRIFIVELVSSL